MAVKLIVMYSRPKDVQAFETVYGETQGQNEDRGDLNALGSPHGKPTFHHIAEIHFPSMQLWKRVRFQMEQKRRLRMQQRSPPGGPPIVLIAEEETFEF